jgi:uncharacterized protein YigE (DUF2233 family)
MCTAITTIGRTIATASSVIRTLCTFTFSVLVSIAAVAQNDLPSADCRTDWNHIATGIDYRSITCLGDPSDTDLHVVRLAPQFFTFDVADVTNGSTARQEAEKRHAAFVINANFFQKDRTPIGVIVRGGDELQPPHRSSWQSIFLIDTDGAPHIVRITDWRKYRGRAQMAVQAGPRIVVHGRINKVNKSYSAARAGVCLQADGSVLFFATPQERKFDMWEIGRIARRAESKGGLACRDAMLFDGGHSTQIYVAGDLQTIRVDGDPVPVFVFAKRK